MAIAIESLKAIYLDIPKVACTTLKTTFAPYVGIELKGESPHQAIYPRPSNDAVLRKSLYSDFFVFGFTRNPWARVVSCYKDKVMNLSSGNDTQFTKRQGVANCFARFEEFHPNMSFEAFVEAIASIPNDQADSHFLSQKDFFDSWPVDFVGRIENMSNDWRVISDRLGLNCEVLPTLKFTPSDDYRDYFSEVTKEKIRIRYNRDIEAFGYDF